jgi:hypothetical protein
VLSAAVFVIPIRNSPWMLMLPAYTGAPKFLETGTDSPVTGASLTSDVPSTTVPSDGTRSPGRTITTSPTLSPSTGTVSVSEPRSLSAVRGKRLTRASIPARARPAATPSSSSPKAKRKTTMAASRASPMASAPSVAIDIKVSMLNGVPVRAPAQTRLAIESSPASVAAR